MNIFRRYRHNDSPPPAAEQELYMQPQSSQYAVSAQTCGILPVAVPPKTSPSKASAVTLTSPLQHTAATSRCASMLHSNSDTTTSSYKNYGMFGSYGAVPTFEGGEINQRDVLPSSHRGIRDLEQNSLPSQPSLSTQVNGLSILPLTQPISAANMHIIAFAGMRGAVSFALAYIFPNDNNNR